MNIRTCDKIQVPGKAKEKHSLPQAPAMPTMQTVAISTASDQIDAGGASAKIHQDHIAPIDETASIHIIVSGTFGIIATTLSPLFKRLPSIS